MCPAPGWESMIVPWHVHLLQPEERSQFEILKSQMYAERVAKRARRGKRARALPEEQPSAATGEERAATSLQRQLRRHPLCWVLIIAAHGVCTLALGNRAPCACECRLRPWQLFGWVQCNWPRSVCSGGLEEEPFPVPRACLGGYADFGVPGLDSPWQCKSRPGPGNWPALCPSAPPG